MCPCATRTECTPTHFNPDFRQAFDAMDPDHDGKISRDDLRKFYAGVSTGEVDEDAIRTMMSAADLNKDGFVEYDGFERVLLGGGRRCWGVMEDAFKVMDKDGDGKLSHEDLKSYMKSAGFSDICDEDVRAMIRLGGGDDTNGVTFDGFLKILAYDHFS